jgi:anti-sigma B factor antagonist
MGSRGIEVIVSGAPGNNDDGSSGPAPFTVRADADPDQTVVAVAGEVDMHTEGQLRDELFRLSEPPGRRLVLDFSGVEFMASAGVAVLLEVSAQLDATGGSLTLAGVLPMVARVLTLTAADELVPVLPTIDEALAR